MKYGCIGEHLGHSFSAQIHGMIADYEYTLCEIPPLELDAFMKSRDFLGINVTIPYKTAVIPYLDYIDDTAKKIGAVNTVVNKDGKFYGYNTDFGGMSALIRKMKLQLNGKKVLIAGTGGTSLTAMAVAESMGSGCVIRLGRSGKDGSLTYSEAYEKHKDADIIINATPCGMFPDTVGCALDLSAFDNLSGVVDAIYNPLRTELVMSARERGINASGGLYMLVSQAVLASEKFISCSYPENTLDDVYAKLLSARENIVLTGMPGSGKSTVGELLAKMTKREFTDTDSEIEKRAGMSIPDIFAQKGEEYFRNLESDVILDISKKNGVVIATGGGSILRDSNVMRLKQNGRIYFLDRPLCHITPSGNRPLSLDRKALDERYKERYPIYLKTADKVIINKKTAKIAAKEILDENTCH